MEPSGQKHKRTAKTTSNGTTTTLISTNLPDYDYSGGEVELVVENQILFMIGPTLPVSQETP